MCVKTLPAIVMSFSPGVAPLLSKVTNDLPVWRRISSEYRYLTAEEALVAQDSAFVVPRMKNYHRFADGRSLRMETVDNVRLLEDYVLPNLPKLVDENIVRRQFAAVCRSQMLFALHEPSSNSIQKSELKSQPKCAMVREHLMFLAECAQSVEEAEIESFVSDL